MVTHGHGPRYTVHGHGTGTGTGPSAAKWESIASAFAAAMLYTGLTVAADVNQCEGTSLPPPPPSPAGASAAMPTAMCSDAAGDACATARRRRATDALIKNGEVRRAVAVHGALELLQHHLDAAEAAADHHAVRALPNPRVRVRAPSLILAWSRYI